MGSNDSAVSRAAAAVGVPDLVERLARDVKGADLTSLLLAVAEARAGRLTAADMLRAYERDRFTGPSPIDGRALLAVEAELVGALPDDVDVIGLAPVVPLATHSALSTVPQNNVVTTTRASEVAADPTSALALEAAVRRRADKATPVHLAAVQRVVRAQPFSGPQSFAHFGLLGVVSAGRNERGLPFERDALARHTAIAARAARNAGAGNVEVRFSDLSADGRDGPIIAAARAALGADAPDVVIADDPDRTHGRGYYPGACFKLLADGGEIGDGGLVDWTQQLLSDRRERLLISGISVDRLALMRDHQRR